MRYFLPPPDESPTPPGVVPVAPLNVVAGRHDPWEAERAGPGEGRLVRSVRMPAAEAAEYVRRWSGEPGDPAHAIVTAAGLAARERSRPDRLHAGVVRCQRLAVVVGAREATALHWSAPEPVTAADEAAWERALARLAADGRRAGGGWRA